MYQGKGTTKLTQGDGDVEKHESVREGDGQNVSPGSSVKLIFNGPFRVVGNIHPNRLPTSYKFKGKVGKILSNI